MSAAGFGRATPDNKLRPVPATTTGPFRSLVHSARYLRSRNTFTSTMVVPDVPAEADEILWKPGLDHNGFSRADFQSAHNGSPGSSRSKIVLRSCRDLAVFFCANLFHPAKNDASDTRRRSRKFLFRLTDKFYFYASSPALYASNFFFFDAFKVLLFSNAPIDDRRFSKWPDEILHFASTMSQS